MLCGLDKAVISILLASVLPNELGRDIQQNITGGKVYTTHMHHTPISIAGSYFYFCRPSEDPVLQHCVHYGVLHCRECPPVSVWYVVVMVVMVGLMGLTISEVMMNIILQISGI